MIFLNLLRDFGKDRSLTAPNDKRAAAPVVKPVRQPFRACRDLGARLHEKHMMKIQAGHRVPLS